MSKSADLWNAMPFEHREIASLGSIEAQIRQIRTDREKAKAAQAKFMRETGDHLKRLIKERDDLLYKLEQRS